GRRLLRAALCHAGPAPASATRSWRLSPLRALRRSHAGGARVLHPQVDRLGTPRDRQATAGHGLCLAAATRVASLRHYRPRGREVLVAGAARGGAGGVPLSPAAPLTPLPVSDRRFAHVATESCTDEGRGHPPTNRVAPAARCNRRCRPPRFHPRP